MRIQGLLLAQGRQSLPERIKQHSVDGTDIGVAKSALKILKKVSIPDTVSESKLDTIVKIKKWVELSAEEIIKRKTLSIVSSWKHEDQAAQNQEKAKVRWRKSLEVVQKQQEIIENHTKRKSISKKKE